MSTDVLPNEQSNQETLDIYIYGTSNAPLSMTPPNPMQGCFPFRSTHRRQPLRHGGGGGVTVVVSAAAAAAAPPASRSSWRGRAGPHRRRRHAEAMRGWVAGAPAAAGEGDRGGGGPMRCGGRSRRVARSWPAGAASGSLRWMAYRRKRKSEEGEFKPPTY